MVVLSLLIDYCLATLQYRGDAQNLGKKSVLRSVNAAFATCKGS